MIHWVAKKCFLKALSAAETTTTTGAFLDWVEIINLVGSFKDSDYQWLMVTKDFAEPCQQLTCQTMKWCSIVTDWDPEGHCMFGNILDLLPYGTLFGQTSYSEKFSAVAQCVELAPTAACSVHQTACPASKRVIFDVSGLPCPDFSTAGKRLKKDGPTAPVYMVHGKWCCENKVPLLLIECTEDRDRSEGMVLDK